MLAQIDATSVDVSVVNALVMLALTSSIPLWIRLWKKSVLIFFQNLSIGLSCGENGGRKIREMFTGISSFPVVCHPARSRSMTTYLPAFCAENFFNQLYIVQFGRCRLPNWNRQQDVAGRHTSRRRRDAIMPPSAALMADGSWPMVMQNKTLPPRIFRNGNDFFVAKPSISHRP